MAKSCQPSLWLCLYFNALPLDQLRISDTVAAIAEKQRIVFVSDAARDAGINPDMRLATAYALQPDIKIIERKPEREVQALQALTEWCYQFTPTVMAYKQFSVLLEIGGSLLLFKGLSRLLEHVDQGLRFQGFRYCSGLAHTREAAWLFSHYHADHGALANRDMGEFTVPDARFWLPRLHSLPLHYLDIDSKKQQQLFNLGLRTLGDVLALPRQELGQRFGRELLDVLTAITGEGPTATADFKPAPHFSAQCDFAVGITRLDELIKPLKQLLSQLLRFLDRQQLAIQQLEWRLHYVNQPCETFIIHTSATNNNLNSLLSLSKLKLEQSTLKAPLECLTLSSDAFTQAAPGSGELFPELSHPNNQLHDYRQLLDKLITRLGSKHLTTLGVGDEHLPEYQQVTRDLTQQHIDGLRVNQGSAASHSQSYLPLWLSKQPLPIGTPGENPFPENPAPENSFVENPFLENPFLKNQSPLRLVHGPQRIDSHWWEQRYQRDYFIARHKNGSYCWIFQDLKSKRWFLQGFYG
jgi:protein ImuB